ncbi:TlpA disulfide reductase family protein [Pedobacter frigoris]|uniref:TlpA family protein disulfide reductase n=1 Tax=Pedobacter frigoris TaxID=2571272 RepID=UPI0029319B61|nr:TlpA disulfide reductase family protein [Pedobacter frigoris]
MITRFKIRLTINTILIISCGFFKLYGQSSKLGAPVVPAKKILEDTMNWLYYDRDHLRLSDEFIAYNQFSKPISKAEFLKQTASGGYLPLKLTTSPSSLAYQLYKMPAGTDQYTIAVIQDYCKTIYEHYKKERKKLPGFNFTDINGKKYNEITTKNKIVVFKFWFVSCLPCRQEMPELNRWVAKYKDRKDILFVSLAFDDKKDLNNFLKKTKFDYAVVANQENYLSKVLGIRQYPTHLIINKKGLVAKAGDANVILKELTKEAAQ